MSFPASGSVVLRQVLDRAQLATVVERVAAYRLQNRTLPQAELDGIRQLAARHARGPRANAFRP